jgi:uncharacterized Tic20 family protein
MAAEETPNNESIRSEPPPLAPETPLASPGELTSDEKMWAMFAHLSALVTGWFGLSFLGPLLIWIIKKDESRFVDYHGKESLNFQLNMFIYLVVAGAIGSIIGAVTCGLGIFLAIPLVAAIAIYSFVMPIIAGVKANSGEYYQYPATFRMIK